MKPVTVLQVRIMTIGRAAVNWIWPVPWSLVWPPKHPKLKTVHKCLVKPVIASGLSIEGGRRGRWWWWVIGKRWFLVVIPSGG